MTKTQDGMDSITVIQTMIKHVKKMPEILGHPLGVLDQRSALQEGAPRVPLARVLAELDVLGDGENHLVVVSLPDDRDLDVRQDVRQRRSDGTSAPVCASNMMEDMKVEELVDKKNIGRFAKLMKLTDD